MSREDPKIFYVGLQRCGTKSFGAAFKANGYRVASWPESRDHDWDHKIYEGRYLEVVESAQFDAFEVYEDGPYSRPDFAKFLYHYYPASRFVYFYRPAADWFQSMIVHSKGRTLGIGEVHCDLYARLDDYLYLKNELGLGETTPQRLFLFDKPGHYMRQYEMHKRKILHFFRTAPKSRFFASELYDPDRFLKMRDAFGIAFENAGNSHPNKSDVSAAEIVEKHYAKPQ